MRVTLGEGNTPLVESVRIGPERGARRLLFKLENCNPSGSYKDRFVAAALGHVLDQGARACIATSSGNTGSALAAYCARYGLRCFIAVNQDAPAGKLAQMQAHGAQVLRILEFGADPAVTAHVFSFLREFSAAEKAPLIVSAYRYCPEGMQGVESIGKELGSEGIDHVFVPVGGGGLYSAVVEGLRRAGSRARVHAAQPAGCSTVVAAFERGDDEIRPVKSTTRVSGLSVPFDIDAARALALLRECGGTGFAVPDEAVFAAQRLMLEQEGIYCEPAAVASVAGWLQALERGVVSPQDSAVCLITGHGFKDPASVETAAAGHPAQTLSSSELGSTLKTLLGEAQ